jgi:deoxyribonuclease-2
MRGLALSLALPVLASAAVPSCKNDGGSDVDYAYAFKYPDGWDYAYMDMHTKLEKSSHQLNSGDSSISRTLAQLKDSGVSYVMWNDEPPPNKNSAAPIAHAKGVLVFTGEGGFWLTHSLPDFPAETGDMWASGADGYGQSFLCINIDATNLRKLSPAFTIHRPKVYATKFQSDTEGFDDVKGWASGDARSSDETIHVQLKSRGGETFHLYGKAGSWGKDLYADLVAPAVGPLLMEGWRHGVGVWGPSCGQHQVLDVLQVGFPGSQWATTKDHSKWAVESDGTAFCVGDINRADGQEKRGGGTVCIHEDSFAKQMRSLVQDTDHCSNVEV